MDELCQLYNEQGMALRGKGGARSDIYSKGLLHGAAHIWIWRLKDGRAEILLQKRAATTNTWPNCYDISAAGHIGLGEQPLEAALRESKEEINLDVLPADLRLFCVHRAHLVARAGFIENEFQWLYSLQLDSDTHFRLQESEVDSLTWEPLDQFKAEYMTDQYVPHGELYYQTVVSAIESAAIAN